MNEYGDPLTRAERITGAMTAMLVVPWARLIGLTVRKDDAR